MILTSNRSREIGDALRRRCLYLYIEHPSLEKEVKILRARVPGASARLGEEIARFVQALRRRPLAKVPGVAETIDWAQALPCLHRDHLDRETVQETLGCILKDRHDLADLAAPDARGPADLVAHLARFAGDPRYEPTARAMAAALPYVDRLLPAHDLESLARLLPLLAA